MKSFKTLKCCRLWALAALVLASGALGPDTIQGQEPAFLQWAAKPPMGWNSWDCFATTITEAQAKAQADYMLPLGVTAMGRRTRCTQDEQYTLMSLWSMARSPLIFGGDMTKMDPFTLSLLTNAEVLAVDQDSHANRQLYRQDGLIAWVADVPGSLDKYLALFNTREPRPDRAGLRLPVALLRKCRVRDLWRQMDLGEFETEFAPEIRWHGAGLYRVSGEVAPPPTIKTLQDIPAKYQTPGPHGEAPAHRRG